MFFLRPGAGRRLGDSQEESGDTEGPQQLLCGLEGLVAQRPVTVCPLQAQGGRQLGGATRIGRKGHCEVSSILVW
jgi:hypothetical protein